jgi:uncharacterized protein (DUF4415 family)
MPTSKRSGTKKSAVKSKRVKSLAKGEAKRVAKRTSRDRAYDEAKRTSRDTAYERREYVVATEQAMPWLRAIANTATQLDPDDAPPLTEEFFERADLYHGNKLVRAGRPRSANPKLALKLRIDPDIVEYFRATGPGWQTRINDTLRKAAKLAPLPLRGGRGY